jgi:GrpB-like predicted nucleotidyltransferase (UPF0157 family)
MRLIGDLRPRRVDWSISEFAILFERLGATVENNRVIKRYVRLYGDTDGCTEVRFFGIEVDFIGHIPEGMIALELSENTLTVLEPMPAGPTVTWRGDLTWNWLDRSIPGAPVGEFAACVPADWTSQPNRSPIQFVFSANAYFERGKVFDDDIRLVEYDPTWPAKFDEMANWLRSVISPEIALRIEHYGSTAIPNMTAKPIIDILLEVPSFAEARRSLIPVFNKPGCEYWWYNDHMCFIVRKGLMGTRTHHIHAAPRGHRIWEGIVFQDYLRAHPDEAARYATLKRKLAEYYTSDREAYTNAKDDFVREVAAKALRSAD